MTDEFTQFYVVDISDELFLGSIDHNLDEMWSAEIEVNATQLNSCWTLEHQSHLSRRMNLG